MEAKIREKEEKKRLKDQMVKGLKTEVIKILEQKQTTKDILKV